MRKVTKPFVWKTSKPATADEPLQRFTADQEQEVLTMQVMGQPASDIEERLYVALGRKFGFGAVEFQPSYLGPKNLTEVRPDFAIHGGSRTIIVYADGEFAHGEAGQIAKDDINDARLFAELQGQIEFPVHIPGRELGTADAAKQAVDARW